MAQTRSGKAIPTVGDPVYARRHKMRFWSGLIGFVDDHRLAGRLFPGWSHADHEDAAGWHERRSREVARQHGCIHDRAVSRYGEPPRLIAGLVGENFPNATNERLREHAQRASTHRGLAHSHWRAAGKRTAFHAEFGSDWGYSMPCRKREAG